MDDLDDFLATFWTDKTDKTGGRRAETFMLGLKCSVGNIELKWGLLWA